MHTGGRSMRGYGRMPSPPDEQHEQHERLSPPDERGTSPARGAQIFSNDNAIEYSRSAQTKNILKQRIWGLIRTVVLVFLFVVLFRTWEAKGYVAGSSKTWFNLLATILSVALGLNFSEVFKSLAKVLRWRLLARDKYSARESDLILNFDSFLSVTVLGIESFRKRFGSPKRWLANLCFAWILLFLCSQAAVALVTLTYDFEAGSDYRGTYRTTDTVNAPDISCYFHNRTCPAPRNADDLSAEETKQGLAHNHGQSSMSSDCGLYFDSDFESSKVYKDKDKFQYYCNRNLGQQQFAYRFLEFNPKDKERTYPWLTNRVITASSGKCTMYNETDSERGDRQQKYNITSTDGSESDTIDIPFAVEQMRATTWIYRGKLEPAKAKDQQCGPRCINVWAHRNQGMGEPSTFYKCPITVGEVSNTKNDAQKIPDDIAYLAAASIAVNGRARIANVKKIDWTQYQFSPFGSPWEIHYKDSSSVGANAAEFAIGSIAYMATQNPLTARFTGNLTHLGEKIVPHWESAVPLLAVIVAAHAALFAAAIHISRSVVIKEDSPLAVARLLRPLVERLGDSGTAMAGGAIDRVLDEDVRLREETGGEGGEVGGAGGRGLTYGPRKHVGSGEYVLDLGYGVDVAKRWPGGRHPEGRYR